MTEQQSPQGGVLPAWARLAAVALAQYTSLAYGLHSPLYTVALLIVCLGLGLALLGWVFWMVVWVRLRRAGYRFGQSTGCGMLLGSVALIVAGGVLASVGSNGDSVALPALLALGLGVSGVAGGVLGAVWCAGRFIAQSARASQAVETLVDLVGPPRHGGGLHFTLYQPAVRIAAYFPAPPPHRRRFAACAGGRHRTGLRVVPRAAHRIREPRQARPRVRGETLCALGCDYPYCRVPHPGNCGRYWPVVSLLHSHPGVHHPATNTAQTQRTVCLLTLLVTIQPKAG